MIGNTLKRIIAIVKTQKFGKDYSFLLSFRAEFFLSLRRKNGVEESLETYHAAELHEIPRLRKSSLRDDLLRSE